jgi:hypothetical protein
MTSIDLQPTWMGEGEYLLLMRGVPSPSHPEFLEGMPASTWFTDWQTAVDDASWVALDEEQPFVEIGIAHRYDAREVHHLTATIEDPALVDVRFLVPVERLSAEVMEAQTQAMLEILMNSPELREIADEQQRRREELREDDE